MISEHSETSDNSTHLVIACITDHPKAMALLRTARSRAQDLGVKWRAVYIEALTYSTPVEAGIQARMQRLLTLAKQMGGEVQHMVSETVEKGVSQLIAEEKDRLTMFIIGSGARGPKGKRHNLNWDRAVQLARKQHIAVEFIPLSGQPYRRTLKQWVSSIRPLHIVYGLLAVAVALLGAVFLESVLSPALFRVNSQNVGLLFMIACAFSAGRFGLLPGLIASVASFLIVNYYFTLPYHTLKFDNVTDTINMVLFLSAALLISLFTSQTRSYAEKAARRELDTQALFTLYRMATNASSRRQALEELQVNLARMLAMDVAFFLPTAFNPDVVEVEVPLQLQLVGMDRKALDLCWREMKTSGASSPFYTSSDWRFEPMVAPGGEIGVLGIKPRKITQLDAWFGRLLTAIADQTASVLEHIEMERSMEDTRLREDREKLRSMLLSSVSHDLKTPLASIVGALSIYRSQGKKLTPEKREMLIETALEETVRLDSFITNILDMTRLESGKIEFRREWHPIKDIIQRVARRLEHRLKKHPLTIHTSTPIEIFSDGMMIEQVLQNVLDNAGKYTQPGTKISIGWKGDDTTGFACEVRDFGNGIPATKLESVFDKYARLQKQDSQVAGTGLGLAICKAMMEGLGGSITASNHPEGGAVFTLYLPQWRHHRAAKYEVA